MARHHAPLLTSIWDNAGFRALSPGAQRLYMQILSQKRLTLVGVVPYSARNLARGCDGLTVDDIERDAAELVAHDYVVIDRDTDELMVRTMLKHDPPRGAKTIAGMWNAWREVDSSMLKCCIVKQISTGIWDDSGVKPPDDAKALRNAPSDAPSIPHSQHENGGEAAIGHLPPSIGHHPPVVVHPPSGNHRHTRSTDDRPTESTTTEPKDPRFETVVELVVEHNIRKHGTPNRANPDRYRTACVNNLIVEHGDLILRNLAKRPDAAAQLCADVIVQELS